MAVNTDIAMADGRMSEREADVDTMFQPIMARSRGDVVRQSLFHLHDHYGELCSQLMPGMRAGPPHDFVGSRISAVESILKSLRHDEMRRYLVAVFFVGLATAEANDRSSRSDALALKRRRLDVILASLAVPLAGSEETLLSWIEQGG